MKDRTLFTIPLTMSLLLLPLGCGDIIGPGESCSGQPANTTVKFEDANLEAEIRIFGGIGPGDDLTCGLLSGIEAVAVIGDSNIRSLAGIQNLTSLTYLAIDFNSITDISPLSEVTSLTQLSLHGNSITDIDALSGLTSLSGLLLENNPNLSNIQPLLDNPVLGVGDLVGLRSTNVSCSDVAALEAKGVTVESDCP